MKVSLFVGNLTAAPAEAICTSTNPRLSLMMGTGSAVREQGGFEVLRECEAIVEEQAQKSGRPLLPAGSAWVTGGGKLPFKAVIHCVASDASHLSSDTVIRACVKNALRRAEQAGCRTVAMPVFATGHARFNFDRAVSAMGDAFRTATAAVDEVFIVVFSNRAGDVKRVLGDLIG